MIVKSSRLRVRETARQLSTAIREHIESFVSERVATNEARNGYVQIVSFTRDVKEVFPLKVDGRRKRFAPVAPVC